MTACSSVPAPTTNPPPCTPTGTSPENLTRFFSNNPAEPLVSCDLETDTSGRPPKVKGSPIHGESKRLEATLRFAVKEGLINEAGLYERGQ